MDELLQMLRARRHEMLECLTAMVERESVTRDKAKVNLLGRLHGRQAQCLAS